jgi:hypothetical protein
VAFLFSTPGVLDRRSARRHRDRQQSEPFAVFIRAEQAKWSKVAHEADIKIN